ncbi:hypothetical protein BAUCODRAFT_543355 [Baudoinia panamericana UAMH 10762]|uniref:Uncharacterized protein n=1 Tax=Baudoinia panamericana (strain UAMH 10762) TaxID=717646 RepID=M2MV78_BAUPA|nr:uncharacterized protein BAUCODRAFT_543355 [Baudoinia panamericana UAMH 10762]EMC95483.1 hypothetical protein BAUCODRAFT_543355 [Baudoinia panamericana UAMH 10762]
MWLVMRNRLLWRDVSRTKLLCALRTACATTGCRVGQLLRKRIEIVRENQWLGLRLIFCFEARQASFRPTPLLSEEVSDTRKPVATDNNDGSVSRLGSNAGKASATPATLRRSAATARSAVSLDSRANHGDKSLREGAHSSITSPHSFRLDYTPLLTLPTVVTTAHSTTHVG